MASGSTYGFGHVELEEVAWVRGICLDAFEHLDPDGSSIGIVDALVRLELRDIRWIIASRGLHPLDETDGDKQRERGKFPIARAGRSPPDED